MVSGVFSESSAKSAPKYRGLDDVTMLPSMTSQGNTREIIVKSVM